MLGSELRTLLVVYQHLPHYRKAVFSLLDQSETFSYEFAASDKPSSDSIKLIPSNELRVFRRLENVQIGRLLWQRGLLRLVLRPEYSGVIFLGDRSYVSTWVAAILCRCRGRVVLMWTHGWLKRERGVLRLTRLIFYRLSHMLLLYGDDSAKLGESMGFPQSRMSVIYNSLSTRDEILRNSATRRPGPRSEKVLLYVGRLTWRKRIDLLLPLVRRLRTEGLNVSLWVVGDGPQLAALQDSARAHGDAVVFHGALYEKGRLATLASQADLCVIPGHVGLSAIQSMESGLPVIASDAQAHAPEAEAIVPGVTGDLFEDGSLDSLTDVTGRWLRMSSAERDQSRTNCLNLILARYSANAQVQAIETAVTSVIGTPRPPRLASREARQ